MSGPVKNINLQNENMTGLSLKDLVILKMFLEKGKREDLFLETEIVSVDILHAKLTNLINTLSNNIRNQISK